ncbi:MAG: M48 family metallopeptidase [Lachnospiraceae bacterium]|nr:M48 family metallopeptidase [Lachnospiraceae bacterium]
MEKKQKENIIIILDNSVLIELHRKKIKNLYLRVHPDGHVTLSVPKRLSDKAIRDFLASKTDWIQIQREKMLSRQNVVSRQELTYSTGETHYLWGRPHILIVEETAGRNSVTLAGMVLEQLEGTSVEGILLRAPADSTPEQRKHLLEEFYRTQLKAAIPNLMEKYSRIVGKAPEEWRIRNMKTRWGTCNVVDKRIWLSLHLAKKDPRCLEYVIVHELTHLYEPNHSKAFWERVGRYYPDWKAVRKLLKER